MPLKPRVNMDWKASDETKRGFSIGKMLENGSVPPEFLGLNIPSHGSSAFAGVAHQAESLRRVENLKNTSVSDQVYFTVKNGINQPVTTAFKMGGKMYTPDRHGNVRIIDKANVDLGVKIKKYREDRIDALMEYAMISDEMACYVFGVSFEEWKNQCGPRCDIFMHADLSKLDCSIEYIESLPANSITQIQSISKLRKLVAFYEPNVNMEGLSDAQDRESNMKDGHNNPHDLTDASQAVTDAQARAKTNAAA